MKSFEPRPILPLLQNTFGVHRELIELVYHLISGIGLRLEPLAELSGTDPEEIRKFLQGRGDLPMQFLYRLAESLNLTPDALLNRDFDLRTAHHHVYGKPPVVPSKYLEEAQSKVLTIINILRFVDHRYGARFKIGLLRSLQLTESMFTDLGAQVNQRLAIDLVTKIVEYTGDQNAPYEIGKFSAETIAALGVSSEFQGITSSVEVFRHIIMDQAVQKFLEKNRTWKIQKEKNGLITVSSTIPDHIAEVFEEKYLYSGYAEEIRRGYLSAVPAYIGLKQVQVFSTLRLDRTVNSSIFTILASA